MASFFFYFFYSTSSPDTNSFHRAEEQDDSYCGAMLGCDLFRLVGNHLKVISRYPHRKAGNIKTDGALQSRSA